MFPMVDDGQLKGFVTSKQLRDLDSDMSLSLRFRVGS